jgi:hypothetical protein
LKPRKEILVGLALSAVLRGDQSGHDLEHFADPGSRLFLDLFTRDDPCEAVSGTKNALSGGADTLSSGNVRSFRHPAHFPMCRLGPALAPRL